MSKLEIPKVGTTSHYLGKKRYQDMETGEIVEMDYIKKTVSHNLKSGWQRVYMSDFLDVLDIIGNSKIKVLQYILENVDSNNKLSKTIKKISVESNVSYKTVWSTIKELEQAKLIKKIDTAWVVMPNIISTFGSDKKNGKLLTEYVNA